MKEKLYFCLLTIVLLVTLCGCSNSEKPPEKTILENEDNEQLKQEYYKQLEDKLVEYGKLVYDNEYWMSGKIKPMIYHMTLNELENRNGYDVTMFKKYNSSKLCDKEKTRINFIVLSPTEEGVTNYQYDPVLNCE